jgi:hypothetical protein
MAMFPILIGSLERFDRLSHLIIDRGRESASENGGQILVPRTGKSKQTSGKWSSNRLKPQRDRRQKEESQRLDQQSHTRDHHGAIFSTLKLSLFFFITGKGLTIDF